MPLPDSQHTKNGKCRYCHAPIWSEVRHCYRCPDWPDTKEAHEVSDYTYTSREKFLRDSHTMYVESYDRTQDDVPPLDYEGWLAAWGDDVLRDGVAYGHLHPGVAFPGIDAPKGSGDDNTRTVIVSFAVELDPADKRDAAAIAQAILAEYGQRGGDPSMFLEPVTCGPWSAT